MLTAAAVLQSGEGGLLVQSRGKLFSIRFFYSVAIVRPALMLCSSFQTRRNR